MNRRRPLVGLIFGSLLFAGSVVSAADRYFTWVDEHGRVRHTLIKEEANPVDERARQVEQEVKQSPAPKQSAPAKGVVTDAPIRPAPSTPESAPEPPAELSPSDEARLSDDVRKPEARNKRSQGEPVATEPAPESEPEMTGAGATTASPPSSAQTLHKPQNPDASAAESEEYNLENYPDGDELAKKGFLRKGDPLPYYSWRDAQGNVRVDYYRPEPNFDKPSSADEAPALSAALVLDGSRRSLPARVNRETLAVLGIDQTESLIQRWMDRCCEGLPVKDLAEWDDSREFQLDFDELAPEFTFSTGESLYRLIRLPQGKDARAFVLQLRTYIDHGVFVPTLAFLDKEMQTQRLVTELVFDFRPESWHSHGFLEARVPVFPSRGDRWLLIMSRQEDQAGQTVVETEQGPDVIPHADHGLLGLAQLGN